MKYFQGPVAFFQVEVVFVLHTYNTLYYPYFRLHVLVFSLWGGVFQGVTVLPTILIIL